MPRAAPEAGAAASGEYADGPGAGEIGSFPHRSGAPPLQIGILSNPAMGETPWARTRSPRSAVSTRVP